MEENNILNNPKKNKKKLIIGSIAIVLLLLVVVIGTTYAYFTMGVQNVSEDTDITIKTGDKNNITLTGGVTNYKLHVDNDDMAKNKVNAVYYGTISESKNYETNEEDATITIGDIETDGELVDDYTCNATINIILEGNMKDKLQENDLVVVIIQGETETTIDLSKDITEPSISFDLKNIEPIKAYVKLTNQDKDQSGLEGKELNLEINVSGFKCEMDKRLPSLKMLTSTTKPNYLKETVENDELLRYVGTQEDVTAGRLKNYICFGTNDKEECLNTPDTYMYRIIGITTDNVNRELGLFPNQLKVIKATPSSNSQVWNHYSDVDIKWEASSLKIYLNETFLPDAINNQWQTGTYWDGLITSQSWYTQDQPDTPGATGEPTGSRSPVAKVGLMYATDYMNAKGALINNWLFLQNGWSGNTAVDEWTMTSYGVVSTRYHNSWAVMPKGVLGSNGWTSSKAVRPVFYITPDITLTGEGTETNPFIIGEV